jgi:hypothetical protein
LQYNENNDKLAADRMQHPSRPFQINPDLVNPVFNRDIECLKRLFVHRTVGGEMVPVLKGVMVIRVDHAENKVIAQADQTVCEQFSDNFGDFMIASQGYARTQNDLDTAD